MRMEPMLQGASNSWFGIMLSALAIPQASGKLKQLVEDHWTILEKVQSEQNIELLQQVTPQLRDLVRVHARRNLAGRQAKKTAVPKESGEPTDLKTPEWEVFIDPDSAEKSRTSSSGCAAAGTLRQVFREDRAGRAAARSAGAGGLHPHRIAQRLRQPGAFPENQRARLSRTQPTWVPASEIRGEGLFFHFKEDVIQKWVKKAKNLDGCSWKPTSVGASPGSWTAPGVLPRHPVCPAALVRSRPDPATGRRVRIHHGLAPGTHLLPKPRRGRAGDGGRADLHRRPGQRRHARRAGVARQAGDAGAASRSSPGQHAALRQRSLVRRASPVPRGNTLHAASCHACLFAPETSCERGNKYLDRAVLVSTVERSDLAFFE